MQAIPEVYTEAKHPGGDGCRSLLDEIWQAKETLNHLPEVVTEMRVLDVFAAKAESRITPATEKGWGESTMVPAATVEELAKLLAEEERVEEKIRETQALLSDIKKKISESLVRRYITMTQEEVPMPEDLMKEEQSYERLLQALLDIKNEIARQIRPLEEQIVQANVDHLKQTFDREKNRLGECLEGIDQKILGCRLHLEEYQRICLHLNALNERLSRLNTEHLPLPDSLPTTDLGEIIKGRLEHLRSEGKI